VEFEFGENPFFENKVCGCAGEDQKMIMEDKGNGRAEVGSDDGPML
jgi:hypothetical protein